MKFNIKNIGLVTAITLAGSTFSACNDALDLTPKSQNTPGDYYKTADQLAAYLNNYYSTNLTNPFNSMYHASSYNDGMAQSDASTDIFVAGGGNTTLFANNHWEVPSGKDLQSLYGVVRTYNYLINTIEERFASGTLAPSDAAVQNYYGEALFFRALTYFRILARYGDAPIITEVLPDENQTIVAGSTRAPRNEVARFILSDLDNAIAKLYPRSTFNGQRVNREVAQVFKSRVALFEATFEKYHQGTGRVPGDSNWPGARMSYNQGKTFNIANEINFFLTEAMSSAKVVADATTLTTNSGTVEPAPNTITGWNPYFEMFSQPSLASVPEVLLWKQYSRAYSITHDATYRTKTGCNDGYTRTFVESFLMKNGLPIYAAGSGYHGDVSIDNVKADRDERLQLFVWGESTLTDSDPASPNWGAVYFNHAKAQDGTDSIDSNGDPVIATQIHITNNNAETRAITGYQPRKYYTYEYDQTNNDELRGYNACPMFRSAEALLNYMEACYLLNGTLDASAISYWQSLRARAGVNTNYQATIDATDLSQEGDFAVYSGTTQVDKTLYNIRRERMNELFSEGLRYQDLIRWRSFDNLVTTKWIPEGCNFWDNMYNFYRDKNGDLPKADGSSDAVLSASSLSKYLRPYSRSMVATNELRDGYNWHEAYYLYPLGINDLQTASIDRSVANSNLYQNINWPVVAGGHAER